MIANCLQLFSSSQEMLMNTAFERSVMKMILHLHSFGLFNHLLFMMEMDAALP